ncbi:MAG TPA: TIGR03790 family protein [Terriglobia bacterium]|nr:TIGR03790 family protein [Terriglobia bacterium]
MSRRMATFACLFCSVAMAQGPHNVLLVVNQRSGMSRTIADYYAQRRHIPKSNICSIRAPEDEEIDRATFDKSVRQPILDCLQSGKLQDRVLYIVLTKGVPLKVKGHAGQNDQASVDSELTLLYQDMLGVTRVLPGRLPNPYFAGDAGTNLARFSHRRFPIYLVTRLDGYDVGDACALVARAQSPAKGGRFILDLPWNGNGQGDNWLRMAADKLKEAGVPASRITLETSPVFLTGQKQVLGYASWGSNDRSDHFRWLGNTWVNGALLEEYVSTDARTFKRPPKDWKIGQWSDPPATFFDGSPQSLIADYIHEGVTGAAGNVYEPYLDACVRPQILFPAYVKGFNLAESYYAAIPFLSWQTVVIGDPLTAPFAHTTLPKVEADPPVDPATGLPKFYSMWKRKVAEKGGRE